MASLFTRKLLKELGLLDFTRAIKRRLAYTENTFMPCTPHLLIAVNRGMRWCMENKIAEGADYLEFGIFRGFTFWYAQALAFDMGIKDMRFFGFDSFFGLPPLKGIDKADEFKEGAYYSPRKDVEIFLTQYGVAWEKTFLVEGWFKDSLQQKTVEKYGLRKCSLCVVDCDLYESAKQVLTFIEPLMQDRSVILFDDWSSFGRDEGRGEQKAFAEFLADKPHIKAEPFLEFGDHGKGFILNK